MVSALRQTTSLIYANASIVVHGWSLRPKRHRSSAMRLFRFGVCVRPTVLPISRVNFGTVYGFEKQDAYETIQMTEHYRSKLAQCFEKQPLGNSP